MKKYRLYKWLIKKIPFRLFQNKPIEKGFIRFIVYVLFIFIIFTCYVSIPILFIMYLGMILYRKDYLRKIGNKIRNQFHRTFWFKLHYLFGSIMIILMISLIILILSMIFTIPIIIFILIGYKMEKSKNQKDLGNKTTYVIKYQNFNDTNKKESKTIESL